jgi:hypothetical protein
MTFLNYAGRRWPPPVPRRQANLALFATLHDRPPAERTASYTC